MTGEATDIVTFRLLLRWRLFGYALPLAMIGIGGAIFPTFHAAGLSWWPVFILALPTLLAIWLAIEFEHCSLSLDHEGIRYRAIGYRLSAPWSAVEERDSGTSSTLIVRNGESGFVGPIRYMASILGAFWSHRVDLAYRRMGLIPLGVFPPEAARSCRSFLTKSASTGEP